MYDMPSGRHLNNRKISSTSFQVSTLNCLFSLRILTSGIQTLRMRLPFVYVLYFCAITALSTMAVHGTIPEFIDKDWLSYQDFISKQNTLLVTVTKTTKRQANLLSVIRSDTFYYVVWQHQNPHMTYHMWNSVNYWATIFSPSQIPFYKDTIFILLLGGILLCKSHSTSRLCSIHHDIPVTMHTPAAYGQMVSVLPQWWQPVGGPRDKIWDLVALVWPIRSQVITTYITTEPWSKYWHDTFHCYGHLFD